VRLDRLPVACRISLTKTGVAQIQRHLGGGGEACGAEMNRDRIVQVRLDPQLAGHLRAFTAQLRSREPDATESIAVRTLLRHALADHGSSIDLADAVRNEAYRRAYAEARAALRETFRKFFTEGEEP
jgi:hypothetical protein